MNKRQKKKEQTFRPVSNKQRIKNQRNTIREMNSIIKSLETEKEVLLDRYENLQIAADIRAERIKIMQEKIDIQAEIISKLKTPWWKRGTKRGE